MEIIIEYGILGIDIDDDDNFDEYIKKNNLDKSEIEDTFTEITPSGSIHYYFKIDNRLRNLTTGTDFPCEKVDFRCQGGFMLCYGSKYTKNMCKKNKEIHRCKDKNGSIGSDENCYYENKPYKIINKRTINTIPDSLLDIFLNHIKKDKESSKKNKAKIDQNDKLELEGINLKDYIDEIDKVLNYLPSEYYDNYSEWIRVGLMLKSNKKISDNENYKLFVDFSKKSSKYDKKEMARVWDNFKPNGKLHINSLFYEAKKHGYEKSDEVYQYLSNGQYGHAQLFYEYNKEDIVISNKIGYLYDNNSSLWKQKDFAEITNMIPGFIQKKIRQELINNNRIVPLNQEDQKKQIARNDELNKLLKQTASTSHIKHVFEQAKTMFYNNDFIKQLDASEDLIPIKNSIVVYLRDCTSRPRTKYDYFTFECAVELLDDNNNLEHATEFFEQIMNNNKENLLFFQKCLGYICSGWTTQRKLFIFWGQGANGKSTICELLSLIFDKFYATLLKSMFIKNKNNSSNDPSELSLINTHIGMFSETEAGEKLNGATLKAITGNDSRSVRPLY